MLISGASVAATPQPHVRALEPLGKVQRALEEPETAVEPAVEPAAEPGLAAETETAATTSGALVAATPLLQTRPPESPSGGVRWNWVRLGQEPRMRVKLEATALTGQTEPAMSGSGTSFEQIDSGAVESTIAPDRPDWENRESGASQDAEHMTSSIFTVQHFRCLFSLFKTQLTVDGDLRTGISTFETREEWQWPSNCCAVCPVICLSSSPIFSPWSYVLAR
uniref:Uncharacterized protein n=1 Tax=Sphaerodactylus townsendi TaxID=933632 RepID=A0ACB8FP48_9SAUR